MKLNDGMAKAAPGDTARVTASDPGFAHDVQSWCRVTGNELLDLKQDADGIVATIRKGGATTTVEGKTTSTNKTIIVFSDDFDRALAAFVIANGALAMGRKVTMFFTFWGLNILKKPKRPPVEKDPVSRLFALLLPSSVGQLKLSKLNMLGIGPIFMRWIMRRKNIDSPEEMVRKALAGGAEIIACQMSMDIMGIKREELIDGITYGGVASYIEAAEKAGMNLFV
jgi:peroxiredoxin family protein/TusA-related sulfurtransferase